MRPTHESLSYAGILTATILATSMALIDASVVNVILPKIQTEFGQTLPRMLWIVQSYGLFLATFLLLGGALGDHYGRKRVFQTGMAVFTVASLACALSPNFAFLVGARALQGLGAAILTPGSLAIINATFPADRRGAAIGTWSAATSIAVAVGPPFGGWLADIWGWRAAFFLNLPVGAVAFAYAARALPPDRVLRSAANGRIDYIGTLLSTLAIGSLVVALTEQSRLALLAGLLLLIFFWQVELAVSRPILPFSIFRSRIFALTNVLTFFLYGALGGGFFYLPVYLISVGKYSSTAAGLATLPFVLLLATFSRYTGSLLPRVGPRILLTLGPGISGLGFATLAVFARAEQSYWSAFFPGIIVLGIGMALTVAPLTSTVLAALSDEQSGIASGVNIAAARLAGLFGVSFTSWVLVFADGRWNPAAAIFTAMAILCAVATVSGAGLPGKVSRG